MHPINFKQSNLMLAKNQPEYQPLPIYIDGNDLEGRAYSCWQLTWRERIKMLVTGRLWLCQLTFHEALQPQLPMADSPFMTSEKADA